MNSRIITFACLFVLVSFTQADPPKNYYDTATDKTGRAFRSALHDIIDDHQVITYTSKTPDTADALVKLDADPTKITAAIVVNRRCFIGQLNPAAGKHRDFRPLRQYNRLRLDGEYLLPFRTIQLGQARIEPDKLGQAHSPLGMSHLVLQRPSIALLAVAPIVLDKKRVV